MRRYPAIPEWMPTRFAEKCIYAQMAHRSRQIVYPNYFLPFALVKREASVSVTVHVCQHPALPQKFLSAPLAGMEG